MHRLHPLTFSVVLAVAYMAGNAVHAQQPAKTTAVTSADQEFVQKAAAAGRTEVEHGKIAASKASNAQVKTYANLLVKEHTAANQQLMAIAKRKNIAIADQTGTTAASGAVVTTGEAQDRQAKGSAHAAPWMSSAGAAFDRGFIEAQVKAHQDAIALFETQANGGGDSDLKAFAQKQLPGLRNHLKQAQDLQGKLGTT